MKTSARLVALLLCAALMLSLIGCTQPAEPTVPAPTAAPTEPPATEPPADELYAAARAALDGTATVTLQASVVTTMTVAGQTFSEASEQTLTYVGLGTDAPQVSLEESVAYNVHEPEESEDAESEEEDDTVSYSEVYADGTVYATLEDTYSFSGALAAEEVAARYLPVVLLDAALYGSMTSETNGNSTTITFSEPTAAESWALPEGAEMVEASGSAVISASGAMEQMRYTITYQYGPTEVTVEVVSSPQAHASVITLPEAPESYPALQYIDALRQYLRSSAMMMQAESITASSMESVVSHAAGVVRNQSTTMDLVGRDEDMMTKIETSIYLMDYSTNQEQKLDQEELYRNGKYTVTVDNGVPTTQTGVAVEDIEEYCLAIMVAHLVDPTFWQDVTVTDLDSVYLMELTYSEDLGNTLQNAICSMFWQDSAFLNKLASAYVTNETTGYISIDKYTGIPTAAGYYYEGTHTIEGTDYILSLQSDQSIEAPALGAYHAITEEMPEEAEPETKATPLFYHVTGENGQEMWLMGTIHVGDERTAYLPQEIYDAFAASDALALEYNSEAFDEQMENDDDLQDEVSSAYYYSDGTQTSDHVDAELYEEAIKYMKASGSYSMNAPYMKPSMWSNSIENFYLRQGYHLTGEQGMEERLTKLAKEQEKEIREVESGLFQIRMLTGWSEELHELLLEEALESSAAEYIADVADLYEKWCAGDEAVMREALSTEIDTSEFTEEELAEYEAELPLAEEYNKAMSLDRNEGMLKVAIEYLESGDTVFFAVGLAHLLDNTNGLVDTLREAGYTVELVEYAG